MRKFKGLLEKKWFSTIFWIILLAAGWEIAAVYVGYVKRTPENILPHLYQIVAAAISKDPVSADMTATGLVLSAAAATILRAVVGYVIGMIVGFILAVLMKMSGIIEKMFFPYLMLILLIPVLGMAPIVLAVTGDIDKSRIIIAAILSFYPVATNTLAGLKSVPKEQLDLMFIYAAKPIEVYKKVLLPTAVPYIFSGLKIAAPMAITASILVDTLQGDGGLGCILSQSLKHAMSIYVFWLIVFFSAFIGIGSTYLLGGIEQFMLPENRNKRKIKRKVMKDERRSLQEKEELICQSKI
ncbi:ABC transporter permease [Eubacterium oxidoreducens]|uniref:NitT/TauT family transport system permease protein n=1 Tax=Eubacterium oxidoreducens TaxID=1732 RepID=A0A1G6CL37_EUBOX|nr:ABC transporter permease subunit [Eubacterium oxidoreducens]SDB33569.1 NitT/TauT family transport system permease protein [Eubacterium oxidoreducens]